MTEIIERIDYFDLYDGKEIISDCKIRTLYYFGSNIAADFKESYIIIKNGHYKLNIGLFGGHETCWKYLSDFQPPTRGFDQKDLIDLCATLGIELKQSDNGISTGCEILFKKNSPNDIIVVMEIYGGRQPEGVYIHSVVFVNHDPEMKKKYFNCS